MGKKIKYRHLNTVLLGLGFTYILYGDVQIYREDEHDALIIFTKVDPENDVSDFNLLAVQNTLYWKMMLTRKEIDVLVMN